MKATQGIFFFFNQSVCGSSSSTDSSNWTVELELDKQVLFHQVPVYCVLFTQNDEKLKCSGVLKLGFWELSDHWLSRERTVYLTLSNASCCTRCLIGSVIRGEVIPQLGGECFNKTAHKAIAQPH